MGFVALLIGSAHNQAKKPRLFACPPQLFQERVGRSGFFSFFFLLLKLYFTYKKHFRLVEISVGQSWTLFKNIFRSGEISGGRSGKLFKNFLLLKNIFRLGEISVSQSVGKTFLKHFWVGLQNMVGRWRTSKQSFLLPHWERSLTSQSFFQWDRV